MPVLVSGAGYETFGLITELQAAEAPAYKLVDIKPIQMNDGNVVVDLKFDKTPPKIAQFIMADPPRVIVDITDASNETNHRILKVAEGEIESVVLIGNDERLRLVINLNNSSQVNLDSIPDGYRVNIKSVDRNEVPGSTSISREVNNEAYVALSQKSKLVDVDFRRTQAGSGRVIVNLSDPDTVVDFREQSGELIADFINTVIDDKDEQRLDVVDFATPVSTVDIFRQLDNVRVVVTPNGQFKHTVTQKEDQYIIEVAPLTQQELKALDDDESGYSGETLSLNFQRIPVRAALQVIADFTGFNIITSDSVSGDLSLRLNDVPWDQALDLILQTKNLGMRQRGNVIRVAPADEINAQELREYEAQREVVDLEPLVTELIRVSYAKAQDLADLLKSIKSVDPDIAQPAFGSVSVNEIITEENNLLSERGSVTVDERTNTLLVQDTPSQIRQIRDLVEKLDIPVRQIQIETRIVEATDKFSRTLGARLGFSRVTTEARFPGTSDNNSLGTVYQSGNVEATNSIRDENEILYPDALSVNLRADGIGEETASSYAYQIAKLGAGYLHLLDLEISALQAEGKGKIVANPKLTTTDSHEAHIEQGQERIFVTGSLVDTGSVTKKAVLSLTVTPQITPDDKIILDVAITNDSFESDTTLNTKRITTQTLLGNGETIVIGGIYQQSEGDLVTKTPILGDIPIIGYLFKKKTHRDDRTELLIFLTPRIVYSEFDKES
ncbi:MAG: type IV pilus secretin PilQ [Proteobacteria bacterium]|nr:type IV pilus secretin PilQ [Pseudomonadota bacterium]